MKRITSETAAVPVVESSARWTNKNLDKRWHVSPLWEFKVNIILKTTSMK